MAKARATLERTLREGVTYGDQSAAGVAHLHLGMVAIREEELDRAEADLRQALAVADGNRSLMAASHNLLGVVVSDRGMDREAVTEYEEAARLFEELNDRSGAGTVYANRCGCLLNLGRIDEAKQELERAEAIGLSLGSVQLRGLVHVNRARVLWATNGASRDKIVSELESARADFLQTGDQSQVRRVEKILEGLTGPVSTEGEETPPDGSIG
jgi:tetratricopeptide (TPR) repeat protein